MIAKYLSDGAASGSEWIALGHLVLPFVIGSLFGVAFALMIRVLGWPPNAISICPISVMFGALSYVVLMAVDPMVLGHFTPQAIWNGIAIALLATWPIAFVIGPLLFIYVAQLRKGRKILTDSTVILLSILCLACELAFLKFLSGDVS